MSWREFAKFYNESRIELLKSSKFNYPKYHWFFSYLFCRNSEVTTGGKKMVFRNFNKKWVRHRCISVKFAKFLKALILKIICERLPLQILHKSRVRLLLTEVLVLFVLKVAPKQLLLILWLSIEWYFQLTKV